MRYRAKVNIEFITGRKITIEHVVKASSQEEAEKHCKLFAKETLQNSRVKGYEYIPCVVDNMPLPSKKFVIDKLRAVSSIAKSTREKEAAIDDLYKAFRAYQPSWDDDSLADILTYCENSGIVKNEAEYQAMADALLEELDGDWRC